MQHIHGESFKSFLSRAVIVHAVPLNISTEWQEKKEITVSSIELWCNPLQRCLSNNELQLQTYLCQIHFMLHFKGVLCWSWKNTFDLFFN